MRNLARNVVGLLLILALLLLFLQRSEGFLLLGALLCVASPPILVDIRSSQEAHEREGKLRLAHKIACMEALGVLAILSAIYWRVSLSSHASASTRSSVATAFWIWVVVCTLLAVLGRLLDRSYARSQTHGNSA